MSRRILTIISVIISITCSAQPLPRKAWLGAQLQPIDQSNFAEYKLSEPAGLAIVRVAGGSAEALELLAGDVLTEINGKPVKGMSDLQESLAMLTEGQTLQVGVKRDGKTISRKAKAAGRPRETSEYSEVLYDSAPYRGGQLNVIINKPNGPGPHPAVLFIPGYTCSSVDGLSGSHPYGRVVQAFAKEGFGVVRIEKSGLGDSRNTPPCEGCTLKDEIENFEAGLIKLKSLPWVDTSLVFIFGHSMGGIVAPAITAKHPIKGVMVYGTTAKSWYEYQVEMNRVQGMLAKPDPLEYEQYCREQSELAFEYFIRKRELNEMASTPATDSLLRSTWQYDGAGSIFGRNAEYWRQIQDMPLLENWANTKSNVLVMYGGADFQAFSKSDHEQIVYTVNNYRPGTATLEIFPETDHYFAKTGTTQFAYDLFANGEYQQLFDLFDPEVTLRAVAWAKAQLGGTTGSKAIWRKLNTDPYPGKQDDICFINENTGWYVNGSGRIYRTDDGGTNWTKQIEMPGTFFRTIAFVDSNNGFAGTVGTDYFPNVSDTIPLYYTTDGGKTWQPKAYSGPYVKGLCAIDIVSESYINHGLSDTRTHIFAAGRVGSPAMLMVSSNGGANFISRKVEGAEMILDIKMFDKNTGIICAGSSADVATSNALILHTTDGGKTWSKVYQSSRPYEITWKTSFPTRNIGYVTLQSYNPDTEIKTQRVVKTTDGGFTWTEYPICDEHGARPFGVGFISPTHGFVGTLSSGFETTDGGLTWEKTEMGRATNKIRIYKNLEGMHYGYAIGVEVLKLEPQ